MDTQSILAGNDIRVRDLESTSLKLEQLLDFVGEAGFPEPPLADYGRIEDILRRATVNEMCALVAFRWTIWNGEGSPWAYILDPHEIEPSLDFVRKLGFNTVNQQNSRLAALMYSVFLTCWRVGLENEFPLLMLDLREHLDALMGRWPLWRELKDHRAKQCVQCDLATNLIQ